MKLPAALQKEDYYSKTEPEIFQLLSSSREGLSAADVEERQKQFGKNVLKSKRFKAARIFFRQFRSPFLLILIAIVIISFFLGQTANSIIISLMIVLSSLLSFFDEYRSEKISEELTKKIAHRVLVERNGKKEEIAASELVPGDLVYLTIGSVVPADLRITESKNLEIDESVLTGESRAVAKNSAVIADNFLGIASLKNCAFSGTVVSYGEGVGVVVNTGQNSELGKISKIAEQERPQTEFQKGLSNFGRLLVKIIVFLTIGIFFINSILKHTVLDSLLFALAIAVGLTPELLPAILSVGLSKGSREMAKKGVIVKRLIAIEDFGNMDVLCTDKTGTLTEGRLSLARHIDLENKENENVLLYGTICNSSVAYENKLIGNPIDIAIRKHANEKFAKELKSYLLAGEVPFDYDRKMMSVIVKKDEETILITKGAPQQILKKCKSALVNGRKVNIALREKSIIQTFEKLSNDGYNAVAVAYRKIDDKKNYSADDESDLILFGFITFIDAPKPSIKKTILRLEQLNIKLKILTGDNEIVTKKIAREVGIPISKIVLAEQISRASDEELRVVVEESNAFCRLTPNDKLRVIKALRANGHEVGYMGDGINDVPALHEADVGISVNDSVDVAKNASDIVLMKKNIDSLVDGVVEGRRVFGNITKYILMGTSSNFGNMFSAAAASIFLPFLPMLPVQILLVNLLYDFSQLTISADNVDEETLKKPKKLKVEYIQKYMLFLGPASSLYDFITYFVMLFIFKSSQALFRTGWFIESVLTETLVIFVIRTNRAPFYKSKPGKMIILSAIAVSIAALVIPFSPLAQLLGFVQPPPLFFAILIVMVVTYLVLVEFLKNWFVKKYEI